MNSTTRQRITGLTGVLALTAALIPAGSAQAAAADASLQEKAAALVTLEIEPEPALTGLKDCDLSIAIWQRLDGRPYRDEVRAAAVTAFSTAATAEDDTSSCTDFIRTGVAEAKKRDLEIEVRTKDELRQQRELKQQAALTIGLTADPDLLALDLRNFVDEIRKRATGARVRTAAQAAFDGTAEDRVTFLTTGIGTAYEADRTQQIEEEAANDAARKQKLIEDAARRRALAVLLTVVTPGMLEASDRDFVTYIWESAKPSTEVRGAAEKTVLSRDPAVWNAFIHTGIHTARTQDIELALRKKFEADLAEAQRVLASAGGYQVLAQAARKSYRRNSRGTERFRPARPVRPGVGHRFRTQHGDVELGQQPRLVGRHPQCRRLLGCRDHGDDYECSG